MQVVDCLMPTGPLALSKNQSGIAHVQDLARDASITGVPHTTTVDLKDAFALRQARGVIDLRHTLLSTTLAQHDPGGREVRQDVPAHGLRVAGHEGAATACIGHDLVRQHHRDVELLAHLLQLVQHSRQLLLSLAQLPTAGVVYAEAAHDGVHDDQRKAVLVLDHQRGGLHQQLLQVLRGVHARVDDVVHGRLGRDALGLRNLPDPIRAEGALGVHVHHLAVGAPHVGRELGHHCQRVAELSLAAPEFSEDLGDGAALHATAQHLVQLAGPGGDLEPALHLAHQLRAGHEAHLAGLAGGLDDFVHLLV
mmetsp:Transcript_126511/g.300443  ORF Transcript_126511/g.300443 Transcript_126511/m.300443 type:complete len:308 (+) Transcript_126511:144-1067(+)